jgi:hypothetical protein
MASTPLKAGARLRGAIKEGEMMAGGKSSGGIRGRAGRRGERRDVVAARPSSGGPEVRDDRWGPSVSRA